MVRSLGSSPGSAIYWMLNFFIPKMRMIILTHEDSGGEGIK